VIVLAILAEKGPYAQPESFSWQLVIHWIMPLIPIAAFYILIVCLWRAAKYYSDAGKEQKRLRMEMGKLAEEMHLLRREIKGDLKGDGST